MYETVESSGGLPIIGVGGRIYNMNTQPLEIVTSVDNALDETEVLSQRGFTHDEIISLLWLRQWYQNGGSDRMEVVRHLEYLQYLYTHGKVSS